MSQQTLTAVEPVSSLYDTGLREHSRWRQMQIPSSPLPPLR